MALQPTVSRRTYAAFLSCLVVLVAGLASPRARGQDMPADLSREKLAAVAQFLKKSVDEKKFTGASALVAQRGKIVHRSEAGLQDVEAKVPVSEGTIFRIASMSKPITSVAIMILVEDGKLAVTDPLSKYVPEFKEMKVLVPDKDGKEYKTVPAAREITIHDLLTHSSGITYGLMNKPFVSKMYAEAGVADGLTDTPGTMADNVQKLAKMPLVCQPGTAWEYGLNTDVLGHIVEVVSGKTLEEFLRERIFKPLKMDDTSFILPKEKRSRLAAVYSPDKDKGLVRVGDKPTTINGITFSATFPTRDDSKYFSGGAALVSTAADYFRFSQMMLNRGELDGARVLKAQTVSSMTRNQLGELRIMFPGGDLMGYGVGVLSEAGKTMQKDPAGVGTYSWGGAFGTFFWIDPKNEVIGVLMTQTFPPDFAVAQDFKRLTYEAMGDGKK